VTVAPTATPDVFFPIVDGGQVEHAVSQVLQDWFLTYTRELELQRGMERDSFPQPRAWLTSDETQREGTHQIPSIVVVSTGLNATPPAAEGDGRYRAAWIVGVGVFTSANTRRDTNTLSRQYSAIIRAIMLQKQGLDGSIVVNQVRWMDESYNDTFQFTDEQTISFAQVIFEIEVDSVVHRFAGPVGPPDPDTQPGEEWPKVVTIDIEVDQEGG